MAADIAFRPEIINWYTVIMKLNIYLHKSQQPTTTTQTSQLHLVCSDIRGCHVWLKQGPLPKTIVSAEAK